MPVITINDMNTIRNNLRVLASFDGLRGLNGKGARKLHINPDGTFGTKDGLFQNIFQRGNEDSLLNADTIETIKRMFSSAIDHMDKYTGADKQRDDTRKLLFQGFRGLVYLSHHGYRTRPNYNRLQALIESVRKSLGSPLNNIIKKGLTDHHWFEASVPVHKQATFTQSDFLSETRGGICSGICMDWCRRALVKNKYSYMTSSKQNEFNQLIRDLTRDVMQHQTDINRGKINDIRQNIVQNPSLTKEAKEEEYKKQRAPIRNKMDYVVRVNEKAAEVANLNTRLRKKSTYQALAQHIQSVHVPAGVNRQSGQSESISDKINLLQAYKLECQEKLNGNYKIMVVDPLFGIPNEATVIYSEEQKENFRKAIIEIDNAVGKLGGSWPLAKAANKFSRMEIQGKDRLNIPENTILCMSDPSEFQPHIAPLINNCINSMGDQPKAFYLMFNYERAYAGLDKTGGHAMAFTKDADPATNIFYAIDPNFGEFKSDNVNGLIFIFSVLLSYYALERNITLIETQTIGLTEVN